MGFNLVNSLTRCPRPPMSATFYKSVFISNYIDSFVYYICLFIDSLFCLLEELFQNRIYFIGLFIYLFMYRFNTEYIYIAQRHPFYPPLYKTQSSIQIFVWYLCQKVIHVKCIMGYFDFALLATKVLCTMVSLTKPGDSSIHFLVPC